VLLCRNNATINAHVKTQNLVKHLSNTLTRDPTRPGQNRWPGDPWPASISGVVRVTWPLFTARRYASAVYALDLCPSVQYIYPCVCLSATSRCPIKTAKDGIKPTTWHDSLRILAQLTMGQICGPGQMGQQWVTWVMGSTYDQLTHDPLTDD